MNLILKNEFLLIVKLALVNKEPFAFVRYSDGEIMLLNRDQYYDDYIKAVSKLWGYVPSESELIELSDYLIASLIEADLIGFPTERHLKREDYFKDAIEVLESTLYRTIDSFNLASVDVAYELLYADQYKELLQDRDTLNYISCRNLDKQFKEKYNIKNINSFIIAPESKFTSGYIGERHYPDQFKKIEKWIKTLNCEGQLCLVGGGVFSKIYNIWFKRQGGVSLDVGAVFDLWNGKKTRGEGRGLDVEYLKYKL